LTGINATRAAKMLSCAHKTGDEIPMTNHAWAWLSAGAWLRAGTPLLLLLATASPVAAQMAGDAGAGRRLSETWCTNCHIVSSAQSQAASTGAPSFRAIAAQKAVTPMALSAFLQTPHHRMPDLHLSREEIDDVSAYILSLRTPSKP
jgi:mono/diheme cytochrome c family protein